MAQHIVVKGAKEHNLKKINISIPKKKLVVVTGVSGSGKSSLVFDILYSEGQRRYIEGLSSYAKQFLNITKKPDIESLTGISPSISVHQRSISHNPKSTVGTLTSAYDYLRLFFSRLGKIRCPEHGILLKEQKAPELVENIMKSHLGKKITLMGVFIEGKKGEFNSEFQFLIKKGFLKAYIDKKWISLSPDLKLLKTHLHYIDVVVDQLIVDPKYEKRFIKALEICNQMFDGQLHLYFNENKKSEHYSLKNVCPKCGYSFPWNLEPRLFSYNNPVSVCASCDGMGIYYEEIKHEDDESEFYTEKKCPDCNGIRLNKYLLNVFVNNYNLANFLEIPISDLIVLIRSLKFKGNEKLIFAPIQSILVQCLQNILNVGGGYLSLNRTSRTLSGGEAQRLRLASHLKSSLTGILYVLDEPSIGLHQRDHNKLLKVLRSLVDKGNSVVVVEHDEATILAADHIIDIGPKAGIYGGEVVAEGTLKEFMAQKSLTSDYISKRRTIDFPKNYRISKNFIDLQNCNFHNLKNINVKIPKKVLCGISGISGSGKSSLVDVLGTALYNELTGEIKQSEIYSEISGHDDIYKLKYINQKPIGKTSRSSPATYVGVMSFIRNFMGELPDAAVMGFTSSDFSFNVKGGRCESCQGTGLKKIEMRFLDGVQVMCEECEGRRYFSRILEVEYKGKNIADILEMSFDEAVSFFEAHPRLSVILKTAQAMGLGYLTLGQSSVTLSGGEAQRIKLIKELSYKNSQHTVYILDEPTTGLHFDDINRLVAILQKLVDQGHTVLVIEHNLDLLRCCDYLIDMGPEGGDQGGEIVAQGTIDQVSKVKTSFTGQFLKNMN